MLTFDERISNIEATVVKLTNETKDIATDDELDAVRQEVFGTQKELELRINTLENNISIVKETLL